MNLSAAVNRPSDVAVTGRRHDRTALCGILLLLATAGCSNEPAPTTARSTTPTTTTTVSETEAMASLLREIVAAGNPDADFFANDERVTLFTQRAATETDPTRQLQAQGQLGYEQLVSGSVSGAITTFRSQLERLTQLGLPRQHEAVRQIRELLAISFLRLGEQQNCIAAHGPESCILPLAGGGIHQDTRGAQAAISAYADLLRDFPNDLSYRWLLNIASMAAGQYPHGVPTEWRIDPNVFASDEDFPRFPNVAAAAGVATMGLSGGTVVEDLNGDGFLDIVTSSWALDDEIRVHLANGDGTFSDQSDDAGLAGITGGLNLIHADYDNDGDTDIFVLRGAWRRQGGLHPNSLLRNEGDGRFTDVTRSANLLSHHPTQTAVWADFDNDGWLDLFIGNESTANNTHPCELYHNNGDGTFSEIARRVGLDHIGFVKGVACGDYDNDGLADLYLSQFEGGNVLYRNTGGPKSSGMHGWRFVDRTDEAGVHLPRMSFPTWFFDYDNDGDLDLLAAPLFGFLDSSLRTIVSHYLGGQAGEERIHLYRNQGDGTFIDVSAAAALDEPILAMGSNFGDLDNDGYLDCYFGTGEPDMATLVPNRMYRNVDGMRFANITTAGGFGHAQKGHGVAFADFDNDGDQDIYTVLGGAFSGDIAPNALFENPGNDHHWVTLVLVGTTCNRSAIGARIRVTVETPSGTREIHATVGSGGSFGATSLQQEIGLGDATEILSVEVRWPGDERPQVWRNVAMDSFNRLTQGEPTARRLTRTQVKLGGEVLVE